MNPNTSTARFAGHMADLMDALNRVAAVICTARQYFPKSVRNSDRYALELASAAVGTAIHRMPDLLRERDELREALKWLTDCVGASLESMEAAQWHRKDVEHAHSRARKLLKI